MCRVTKNYMKCNSNPLMVHVFINIMLMHSSMTPVGNLIVYVQFKIRFSQDRVQRFGFDKFRHAKSVYVGTTEPQSVSN